MTIVIKHRSSFVSGRRVDDSTNSACDRTSGARKVIKMVVYRLKGRKNKEEKTDIIESRVSSATHSDKECDSLSTQHPTRGSYFRVRFKLKTRWIQGPIRLLARFRYASIRVCLALEWRHLGRPWTSEAKDETRRWQLKKSTKEWFSSKMFSRIQRGRKIMHTQYILA
jgi:hypothetical protein